jgi:enoyl-CoA hydratase/carnithine racemase
MSAQLIDLKIENRIGRLLLQRASAANAFTTEMMSQFLAAVTRAGTEADILIISSAGEDFSVGRDRQEPKGSGAPFDAFKLVTDVNAALASFPGVAVCVVRGRAFGFAIGLIMRSDIAIAAENARFALDEVKLGIPPMFIMAEILEHLAPKSALDIVLSSREFGAAEAKDMGLLSRVVAADRLQATADELVGQLRERNPAVLQASKRYLRSVRQLPAAARGAYALVEQTRFAERSRH